MAKFLIEVPHEKEAVACARAVKLLLETGSHWLTNAEFGCKDGDHRAWMMVELDSKEDARRLIPSSQREGSTIVGLNKFSLEWIDDYIRQHSK
jgi:hypothetical protein